MDVLLTAIRCPSSLVSTDIGDAPQPAPPTAVVAATATPACIQRWKANKKARGKSFKGMVIVLPHMDTDSKQTDRMAIGTYLIKVLCLGIKQRPYKKKCITGEHAEGKET